MNTIFDITTDVSVPQPPSVGTVVWVRVEPWPFWPAVTVTREWAESQVAEELVHKLPPSTHHNCVVRFFNYNDYIEIVDTADVREFCKNIHLTNNASSHSKDVMRAVQEAIKWLQESGNGTRTQLRLLHEPSFRRTLVNYGLQFVNKQNTHANMKLPRRSNGLVVSRQAISHAMVICSEEEDEEKELTISKRRPVRKARPAKKLIDLSSDSSDDDLDRPSNRPQSNSVRKSTPILPWVPKKHETKCQRDEVIDCDADDKEDQTEALLDANDEPLAGVGVNAKPSHIAHNRMPVPRRITDPSPISRRNGVMQSSKFAQKRPPTLRMSIGSKMPQERDMNRRAQPKKRIEGEKNRTGKYRSPTMEMRTDKVFPKENEMRRRSESSNLPKIRLGNNTSGHVGRKPDSVRMNVRSHKRKESSPNLEPEALLAPAPRRPVTKKRKIKMGVTGVSVRPSETQERFENCTLPERRPNNGTIKCHDQVSEPAKMENRSRKRMSPDARRTVTGPAPEPAPRGIDVVIGGYDSEGSHVGANDEGETTTIVTETDLSIQEVLSLMRCMKGELTQINQHLRQLEEKNVRIEALHETLNSQVNKLLAMCRNR